MNLEQVKLQEVVDNDVWMPKKKGDKLLGVLIAKDDAKDERSARYHLETTQGLKMVWGTAIIDNKMRFVSVGQVVEIEFAGVKNQRTEEVSEDIEISTGDWSKDKTLKLFKVSKGDIQTEEKVV